MFKRCPRPPSWGPEYTAFVIGRIPSLPRVPLVIYAPPHSGKSTLCGGVPGIYDTDYLAYWQGTPKVVVTNIPEALAIGITSVAVLPDEATFRARLRARSIVAGAYPTFPERVIVVHSNDFLGDIDEIAALLRAHI
ncbi:hypothetical protein [Wenling toga-like virus]|uniref:hypothetical protein n=1 Tax=Wenling toga-like virus TaxID=1923542 RepID=UPI00090BCD9C|nr:hypothetical protein [Wenling toga-like virus]APG77812.1 hypothetical protein [Wenling toga-like virus]